MKKWVTVLLISVFFLPIIGACSPDYTEDNKDRDQKVKQEAHKQAVSGNINTKDEKGW